MALALKELGFRVFKMFGWYIKEDDSDFGKSLHALDDRNFCFDAEYCVIAPLWQQATDWLRETHGVNVEVNYLPNVKMYGVIVSDMDVVTKNLGREENIRHANDVTLGYIRFETHGEALEHAVLGAIEKLKGKKK